MSSFLITEEKIVPLREDFVRPSEKEIEELSDSDIYIESFGTEWAYLVDAGDGAIYAPVGSNAEIVDEGYWRGWARLHDAMAILDKETNEWEWRDRILGVKEWRPPEEWIPTRKRKRPHRRQN